MTRILVFVLVCWFLMILLGPLYRYLYIDHAFINLGLISMIYLSIAGRGTGYNRPITQTYLLSGGIDPSGGIAGIALGYIRDVLGGGLKGIHCLSMAILYLFSLWLARQVYLAGTLSIVIVTFLASLFTSLIEIILRWIGGVDPSWGTLMIMGLQAIFTAATAPILMRLFRWIDNRLARDSADRGSLCQ